MQHPILILHNGEDALAGGHDPEAVLGVRSSAQAIEAVLARAGRRAVSASVFDVHDMLFQLRTHSPTLVVNLVESLGGRGDLEAAACSTLELLGVPYTGSPPLTLALCQNKSFTKSVLVGNGVPTPSWCLLLASDVIEARPIPNKRRARGTEHRLVDVIRRSVRFPCIVKPAAMDGSHGIGPESVVFEAPAALDRAAVLVERYGVDVLVETFVPGREINAAIVGNGASARCLPLSEIHFRTPIGVPPIVTYGAKWIDGSEEWGDSEVLCPAPLSDTLAIDVQRLALGVFRSLGCRDYARVDIRITADGEPYLLEVNPNPDLAPDAGLARSAQSFSWSYDELVNRILEAAEGRLGRPKAAYSARPLGRRDDSEANGRVLTGRGRLRAVPR